jgi:hypothetical protein
MRRSTYACVVGMVTLALVCSISLSAQVRKDTETGLDRVSGVVQSVDKAKSTIVIRQQSGPNWTIAFDAKTKFSKANEPSTLDEVKEGVRVICLGKAAEKDMKLQAERIEVRLPR